MRRETRRGVSVVTCAQEYPHRSREDRTEHIAPYEERIAVNVGHKSSPGWFVTGKPSLVFGKAHVHQPVSLLIRLGKEQITTRARSDEYKGTHKRHKGDIGDPWGLAQTQANARACLPGGAMWRIVARVTWLKSLWSSQVKSLHKQQTTYYGKQAS